MAALIALQLRILWRGIPQALRVAWVFVAVMLLQFLSRKNAPGESFSMMLAMPLALIPLGTLLALAGADPLIWQAPLRRSARVWARAVLLALSGALGIALVVAVGLALRQAPTEPVGLLVANLWVCWVGGGLLILLAADLVRPSHPIVQAIVLILAIAPGAAVVFLHLTTGLPWPALAAELVAAAAFLGLNLFVNRDLEFTFTPTGAPEATAPEVVASSGESLRLPDRVPGLASALLRGQYASVLNWVFAVTWIAFSALPVGYVPVIASAIFLPFFVGRFLAVWRPFQATPAPRAKAMAILFLPLLGLWVLTLSLQCLSVSYTDANLFNGSLTGFRLPLITRAIPSPELEGRLSNLPPAKVAELVRDAYRTGYGLDVPVSEILALQTQPESREGWLLDVDARWAPEVRSKILQGRLLIGAMMLAWGMLSFVTTLPGRWPRWLSRYLFIYGYLLIVLPSFFKGQNSVVAFVPDLLLPLYQTAFDRPWIAIAAFAAFSGLFLIRNYRVFRTSELAPEQGKVPA